MTNALIQISDYKLKTFRKSTQKGIPFFLIQNLFVPHLGSVHTFPSLLDLAHAVLQPVLAGRPDLVENLVILKLGQRLHLLLGILRERFLDLLQRLLDRVLAMFVMVSALDGVSLDGPKR